MLFKFSQKHNISDVKAALNELRSDGVNLTIKELIPYQNKTTLINLAASRSLHGKMSGNYLARSKGRGMEFDEVRHYQTGDDIRAIDWRVTARTGKTHTKLFREEIERPVLIATDISSSMLFGSKLLFKSMQAAHLAALVAWHAKSRGDRIGGIVFNQNSHTELKPRSRKQGVLHYLHALVQSHQEALNRQFSSSNKNESTNANAKDSAKENKSIDAKTIFEQNCGRLRQLARPGSLVYLITDGHHLTNEAIRHLSYVSQHCELVICLINDILEQQLPQTAQRINVAVTDGVNRQQLTLGDKNIAKKYAEVAMQRSKAMQHLIEKSGARLLTFNADTSLEVQLKNGRSL